MAPHAWTAGRDRGHPLLGIPVADPGGAARGVGAGSPEGTEVLAGRRWDVGMDGGMDGMDEMVSLLFASVIFVLPCQCPILGGGRRGAMASLVGRLWASW